MFQHQDILASVTNCPPDDFTPEDRESYRFVFPNDQDRSFIPLGLMIPQRVKPLNKDNSVCRWYSLSMYDSIRNAKLAFEDFDKNNKIRKKIKKGTSTIGNGLAVAQLKINHGLMNKPARNGHFDFFPYNDITMKNLFSLVCEL